MNSRSVISSPTSAAPNRWRTSPRTQKYPSTQIPKYPNTQVPKYPSTQVPKYPSTQRSDYPKTTYPSPQINTYPTNRTPQRQDTCERNAPAAWVFGYLGIWVLSSRV